MRVISYHQLANPVNRVLPGGALVLDEAEALDSLVWTPDGAVPMVDIRVGDEVIGGDGQPVKVIGVYPKGVTEVYRVRIRGGGYVDCSPDHVWQSQYRGKTFTTREMAGFAVRYNNTDRKRLRVPVTPVIDFDSRLELPVDPYLVGVMAGDGSFTRSNPWVCAHEDDAAEMRGLLAGSLIGEDSFGDVLRRGTTRGVRWSIRGGSTARALAVIGTKGLTRANKFVPESYLRSEPHQRLALLRGLMDTDGYIKPGRSRGTFVNGSRHLADAVVHLARSLGGHSSDPRWKADVRRREGGGYWVVNGVWTPEIPFVLHRKALAWRVSDAHTRQTSRSIVAIEQMPDAPTQCIEVANDDGLYVTGGTGMVVTHNCHRLKSRDVSWSKNAMDGAAVSTRVHLASGTPTPNGDLTELYGQMRLINPEIPAAYWSNIHGTGWVERWFVRSTNEYSQYVVDGTLKACVNSPCVAPDTTDCIHRQEFWAANVGDLMLRRPEELLDLPDLSGFTDPMDTPMTTEQARVYRDLKKDFLASLPEEGIDFEAMTTGQKFVMLMQAATGLSSVTPNTPELDKHSGKRGLLAELLPDRSHPTVLGVYFRNTAASMARMCDDLGLRYAMYGAATLKKDQVIEEFQCGGFDVLVASIMVVREGITLTAADQVALVERSWVGGDNEQTVRRVRRRGQNKSVTARQLVTPRTVDTHQWNTLQNKTLRVKSWMSKAELASML